MATTRKLFVSTIAMAVVLLSTMSIHAEQADKYTRPHEPFTAPGMQVRMSIVNPINNSINNSWQGRIEPTVFQEIAPCRLSSTLSLDRYDTPWGGSAYSPNESRVYRSRGVLATSVFVDPCSEAIPSNAIGIVGRFTVTPGDGDGEVHIDPTQPGSPNATTVFKFKKGEILMFEAGVMLGPDGTFGVQTWNAGADVTVDILGYLLPDPNTDKGEKGDTGAAGAIGPKGDKGDAGVDGATGPKGDTGATGAIGPKGDTGAIGAKGDTGSVGPKGDKGDTGAAGAIGPKGDKGDAGSNGAKGDKGDTGANGAKGDKGDIGPIGLKGDKGDTGAIGPKGDKGDTGAIGPKGDKGDTGAIGPKGDKGDTGAIGPKGDTGDKGDKGDTGATGAAGEKGDKGDTGAIGPKGDKGDRGLLGPMGPEGPSGLPGPKGDKGDKGDKGEPGAGLTVVKGNACYPPGNNANSQLTVEDSSVHASSVVILNYTDAGSNGNALAIISQTEGSFQTTGSPNRCFQYAVFNNAQ